MKNQRGKLTKEEWEQYKDLEFYPWPEFKCGCPEECKIPVKKSHKESGVPNFVSSHFSKTPEFKAYLRSLYKDKTYEEIYGDRADEVRKNHSEARKGFKFSEESTRKMSKSHLGVPHPHTAEQDRKISEGLIKAYKSGKRTSRSGEDHPNWKGGKVEITCKICGKKKLVGQSRADSAKYCSPECYDEDERDWNKGPNHYNWRGGISFEPYPAEFNDDLKRSIKERDDYVCQLCGLKEGNGILLCVHHIDYVKENLVPFNLITLCRGCNGRVNFDREKWEIFFKSVVGAWS